MSGISRFGRGGALFAGKVGPGGDGASDQFIAGLLSAHSASHNDLVLDQSLDHLGKGRLDVVAVVLQHKLHLPIAEGAQLKGKVLGMAK